MISYHHSEKLYASYKGKNKKLILFDGTHNSNRPKNVVDDCFQFIQKSVKDYGVKSKVKNENNNNNKDNDTNNKLVFKL